MAKNISVEKIAEIYKKKGCNITAACAALNITRQTFYTRKAKSKEATGAG